LEVVIFFFGLLLFVPTIVVAQLSTCSGSPNTNPIIDVTPRFVKQVANGKLYMAGSGDDEIYLVHLWGTAYQMGYAQGLLLKNEINELIPGMLAHWEQEVVDAIDVYINEDMAEYVATYGLLATLDLEYEHTKPYSPQYFYDELRGISDASGVDYQSLVQVHMLPELVKAGCSIFGAWSNATADNHLYQLRALDWDTSGPMQKYPMVAVYHPDPNKFGGHPFANVGWAGWIGSITGMSSVHVGMSEKVADDHYGTSSREGYPFNYLMRDILQFDENLDEAIARIVNARRTCAIFLGCGDGKPEVNKANLFQYIYSQVSIYDDDDVVNYPNSSPKFTHPLMDDVVYWGVHQQCFSAALEDQYGNINPQNTIQHIISMSQTGDLHAAIYDLTDLVMWVGNARAEGESGPANTYDRSFVKFDLYNMFFNEIPPTTEEYDDVEMNIQIVD